MHKTSWYEYTREASMQWKISSPLLNSYICHFTVTCNATDFLTYSDFYIFETVWSVRKDWQELWLTLENWISYLLNNTFAKLYNPSEHLEVENITVLFKGRVTSSNTFPGKHFGININNCATWLTTLMMWLYTWERTVKSNKMIATYTCNHEKWTR